MFASGKTFIMVLGEDTTQWYKQKRLHIESWINFFIGGQDTIDLAIYKEKKEKKKTWHTFWIHLEIPFCVI